MKLPSSKVRQYFYGILAAGLAVLVFYKIIDPAAVPLWLALGGAVLASGGLGAASVVTKVQRSNGTLDD